MIPKWMVLDNFFTAGGLGMYPVAICGFLLLASAAVFLAAAASLNRLTFALSPVALLVLMGYAYTKRFTWLSHFALGLCLAIAPVGAWIAVRGSLSLLPALIGAAVLFWTAGFDILYALQDEEFDRRAGLHSIPARFGTRPALVVSALCHAVTAGLLGLAWRLSGSGPLFGAALLLSVGALAYQHAIVRPGDLSRVNAAFFTANGFVSLVLCAGGVADVLAR